MKFTTALHHKTGLPQCMLKDFANHRHKNDALPVDRIVCEVQMKNPSPVIAHKVCGKEEKHLMLKEENFQSKIGQSMLCYQMATVYFGHYPRCYLLYRPDTSPYVKL